MNDVAFGELVVRMVVSLGVVLLLVLAAYLVVKRRVSGGAIARLGSSFSGRRGARGERGGASGGSQSHGRSRPGATRNALKVLGRAGAGRSSNVMAVQFADRVLLLGVSDGIAPVLLADVDVHTWDVAATTEGRDGDVRITPLPIGHEHGSVEDRGRTPRTPGAGEQSEAVSASLGLIEALREATARRV